MKKPNLIYTENHGRSSYKLIIGIAVVSIALLTLALSIFKPSDLINSLKPNSTPVIESNSRDLLTNNFQASLTTIHDFEFMKVSLKLPPDWTVSGDTSYYVLASPQDQEIQLGHTATNFDSLQEHLNYLDQKRPNLKTITEEQLSINSTQVVSRIEFLSSQMKEQKVYYFYNDLQVVSLTTENLEAYPLLDEIAQTFTYLGK